MATKKDELGGAADTPAAPDAGAAATAEGTAAAPKVDPNAGPTIAEWVLAGYSAKAYPPSGYNSKSTKEEIDTLVALEASGATKEQMEAVAHAQEPAQGDQAAVEVEPEAEAPRLGTNAAAAAAIADLPDHPNQPGAKILDRPFTTGASG
jgi:hypothetical protein